MAKKKETILSMDQWRGLGKQRQADFFRRPSHTELCKELTETTKDRADCRVQILFLKDEIKKLEDIIERLHRKYGTDIILDKD